MMTRGLIRCACLAAALFGLGCEDETRSSEEPAPAASNIPRAAPNASGIHYPPPTAMPPGSPSGPSGPPPHLKSPFGSPDAGSGTHL